MKIIIYIILIVIGTNHITGQITNDDSIRFQVNYYSDFIGEKDGVLQLSQTNQIESEGQYRLVGSNSWKQSGTWKYYDRSNNVVLETLHPNDSIGTRYINQWLPNQQQILKNGVGIYYQIGMNRVTEFGLDSTVYEIRDSLKNGSYVVWCPTSSSNYYKCQTGQYLNSKQQALRIFFNENGGIKMTYNFVNDQRQGEFHKFYSNGKYSEYGLYKDNQKTNQWKFWSTSGNLSKECNYENGVLKGTYIEYFSNGQIKIKGQYGLTNGLDTMYFFDPETYVETLKVKKTDSKSHKHGIWFYYNANGELISSETFEYGVLKK